MRKLAAIMFTDIVGYTALMGESEQKAGRGNPAGWRRSVGTWRSPADGRGPV